MNPTTGTFYTPQEAYESLGIFGGDDSLTIDVETKTMELAASEWGLILIMEEVPHGTFGIDFLARIYGPHVWFGDANSTCDIPRQACKMHLTVNLPPGVTPEMKLLEKARSFNLTDENTPLIGNYVKKVMEIYGKPIEANHLIRTGWQYTETKDNQYPNDVGEWADAYFMEALPEFQYANFLEYLTNATTLKHLLELPSFMETPPMKEHPTVAYIVNEDTIVGEDVAPTPKEIVKVKETPEEYRLRREKLKLDNPLNKPQQLKTPLEKRADKPKRVFETRETPEEYSARRAKLAEGKRPKA